MSWYDESDFEKDRAASWLKENFPGDRVEILATFDIAWVGWECDWKGALVAANGVPELVIVDQVDATPGTIPDEFEQKIKEYRRLADETEAALRRYREMGGLFGDVWREATNARHQRVIDLEQREGETEEEHAARVAGLVTSEVINTIDLSRRPALAAEVARTEGELRRDPNESDADHADRKELYDSGARMVMDVASLPIEEVREILETIDAWIDLDKAAKLMNTSPELVLHRVRLGDLHLSRGEVVGLARSEMPKQEALAEFVRIGEEIESQKSADGRDGDAYDPAALEVLRDLKPRQR